MHLLILKQATVTYYLLFDNRFRANSGYLGSDFQETMVWFDEVFWLIVCFCLHLI